jgi:hypothetical protein
MPWTYPGRGEVISGHLQSLQLATPSKQNEDVTVWKCKNKSCNAFMPVLPARKPSRRNGLDIT